jgi:hypothetical protein
MVRPAAVPGASRTWPALVLGAALLGLAGCGTPLGEACGTDLDCGATDLFCLKPTVAGTLAARGVCSFAAQAAGGRCLSSGDCEGPAFCSNELSTAERLFSGTCTAPQASGEPCWKGAHCASPAKCLGATAAAPGKCG